MKLIVLGGNLSSESYLCEEKILEAVKKSEADAVHPGYGFLSENLSFVKNLEKMGITFIGATPQNISDMADKLHSREIMKKAGIPVVEGSEGTVENLVEARQVCEKIGYPVMIKASAGGGGKGIRVVYEEKYLASSFRACKSEGKNSFNDDRVFIENLFKTRNILRFKFLGIRREILFIFMKENVLFRGDIKN